MAVETMGLDSLFTFGKYGPPASAMLEDVIEDEIRRLEIAGALIAAEIDRIEREPGR